MFRFRITALTALFAVAAIFAGSALAGTAKSAKIIPFTATYAGKANLVVADEVATMKPVGVGKGTPIGASKLTGVGTGAADTAPACKPWKGTGVLTSAKGNIKFTIGAGQACGDESGETFALTARATVAGGTGIYKKAKGSLKVTGTFTKSANTFQAKFTGKLTV